MDRGEFVKDKGDTLTSPPSILDNTADVYYSRQYTHTHTLTRPHR